MRIGLEEDGPWALIPEGIFFSKYPLPSAAAWHLAKALFAECQVKRCRVLRPGTRQRPSLPSVRHGTRQSIFVFF